MPTPSLLDRFRGCLLGQAIGDALGAPFETMPASSIYYGFGLPRKIIASPPVDPLEYTDDAQMMIGIAETLIDHGEIKQHELMHAFVTNFDPARAYGAGAHRLIDVAAAGGDWQTLSRTMFPGGSFGNGAAMRAAPLGLFFHNDLDRVDAQASLSALPTHTHPIGIDGARIMAIAVALMTRDAPFDAPSFYGQLLSHARTDAFRDALSKASQLTHKDHAAVLGTSIEAHRSVPTALACFATYPDSYIDAVGLAIGLGGDVDTIAAMVGALCGARLGIQAIPTHLLTLLEDGPKGRTYIDHLAKRLFEARQPTN